MVDERNNNTGIENEGQDINLYACSSGIWLLPWLQQRHWFAV